MTDLLHILPDSPHFSQDFAHLLPSLDRHKVTTSDILTLDALDVAKRAQVPVAEVKRLADAILRDLHAQLHLNDATPHDASPTAEADLSHRSVLEEEWRTISTLDEGLDSELGGGIPAGYLAEITGESGAGKTQFLLTLLLSVQLAPPRGLSKSAVYISTEAALATNRLHQLLQEHPLLSSLPKSSRPSLQRVLSIQTPDLESQDHILRYQLPIAITRHNVGLIVIDSIAANYRAEFERPEGTSHGQQRTSGLAMAQRSAQLVQLGSLLRKMARTNNVAIVVANQVADRFTPPSAAAASAATCASASTSRTPSWNNSQRTETPPPPPLIHPAATPNEALTLTPDPLTLDHQQRWFTGWGDMRAPSHALKTPSLGLVWSNQIAARIALLKQPVYGGTAGGWVSTAADGREDWRGNGREVRRWRRWMKVVWAAWAPPSEGKGIEFAIEGKGLVSREVEEGGHAAGAGEESGVSAGHAVGNEHEGTG
ncbi:P-loop containing nucleoside triphosphate hydrolase protein [Phyllosticta paracitricarpa]|uniref:DNA repair protein-like protein RAD57 n=1 Tax=Phyllosticta citricarpa TaxID=55181 RepID=A0ABR1LKE3_9PEZI